MADNLNVEELKIALAGGSAVPALLLRPEETRALFVLAHGAGAGMRHPFMEEISRRLAAEGIATLRYQFPCMATGSRRPDPPPTLIATVRAAVAEAKRLVADVPVFAGGKSMGGRMTSLAAAESPLAGVLGLVFLGFPLHPAGQPGIERARHLARLDLPMLFLQGERDRLAELRLLRTVIQRLPCATLHAVPAADHSFHVPKRVGDDGAVLSGLAAIIARWSAMQPTTSRPAT